VVGCCDWGLLVVVGGLGGRHLVVGCCDWGLLVVVGGLGGRVVGGVGAVVARVVVGGCG